MLFASSQSPSSPSTILSTQNPNLSSTNHHRNQIFSFSFRCPLTSQSKSHPPPAVSCCASQQPNMTAPAKEAKLWGGRFEEGVTDAVERFTESISFDKALYKHDIMGSRAHASMLAKQVSCIYFNFDVNQNLIFYFYFGACFQLVCNE